MSLIRIKNIFTPANMNSIVILYDYKQLMITRGYERNDLINCGIGFKNIKLLNPTN